MVYPFIVNKSFEVSRLYVFIAIFAETLVNNPF